MTSDQVTDDTDGSREADRGSGFFSWRGCRAQEAGLQMAEVARLQGQSGGLCARLCRPPLCCLSSPRVVPYERRQSSVRLLILVLPPKSGRTAPVSAAAQQQPAEPRHRDRIVDVARR